MTMKTASDVKKIIIGKTKELVRKNARITIKDIAQACYINIAAVNYHFGSKEELLEIVMKEIIDELKQSVYDKVINLSEDQPIEEILETMIHMIFSFAIDNAGVIQYMFMHNETQENSVNLMIESFFTENEFTKLVFGKMSKTANIDDPKELYARYMLLFSCFSIPIFLQIAKGNSQLTSSIENPDFLRFYIRELLRIIK